MDQTRILHDITTSVHDAVRTRRDGLAEAVLVDNSDALLAMLPSLTGAQPTTTDAFLRRHTTPLHEALCRGQQPREQAATMEHQLHNATRAVMVVGVETGMSIEAAVGVALVLYKRGIPSFCALPAGTVRTT